MKIGAESRPKLILAIVLGVLALALGGHLLFSFAGSPSASEAASPPIAPAATDTPKAATRTGLRKPSGPTLNSLDPTLRFDWLRESEDTKYEGTGRNIFRAQVDIPPPIAPGVTDHKAQKEIAAPTGPPPPPPIQLKFYGFASRPGEPKRIFLSQGEDIFIASEGDIVDRRYKILRISPVSVEVEDVLNNNRQEIPLTPG
jgi:hypothetical protein